MSTKIEDGGPALNTDREIWRERSGDFYADSIHVTASGSIGIDCGGMVYTLPVREWHRLAALSALPHAGVSEEMVEAALNVKPFDDGDENVQYILLRGLSANVQYILLRGLSAIGFTLPSHATWDVMRSALEAARSSQHAEAVPVARSEDDMPERIWAGDFNASGYGHCVAGPQGGLYAEYVRADLASPSPVDAGEPGIKALEWQAGARVGSYTAHGLSIFYVIAPGRECVVLAEWEGSSVLKSVHNTVDMAKAFAQTSEETRIRSALVPATSQAKGEAATGAVQVVMVALEDTVNLSQWEHSPKHRSEVAQAVLHALRTSAPVGQQAKEGGE